MASVVVKRDEAGIEQSIDICNKQQAVRGIETFSIVRNFPRFDV
jgi:hypothetical protein